MFANVGANDMSAFLGNYRIADLTPHYSPLDAGVLGVAVAHAYGGEFDAVLKEKILTPLGMSSTGFDDAGLVDGHAHGQVAAHWHFGALSGSAGLRSTLGDLLDFLQANLQPQQSTTLRAALLLSRQPRLDAKSQVWARLEHRRRQFRRTNMAAAMAREHHGGVLGLHRIPHGSPAGARDALRYGFRSEPDRSGLAARRRCARRAAAGF